MFFAVGALLTWLLAAAGVLGSVEAQLLAFSISSFLLLVLFRKTMVGLFKIKSPREQLPSDYAGDTATVTREIDELNGAVSYRGSVWLASRADGRGEKIPVGETVTITGTEGVRLKVKPYHNVGQSGGSD
jgi:membrane protein implicated in regulation of membrane protease activity